jgi:hypothetical protein
MDFAIKISTYCKYAAMMRHNVRVVAMSVNAVHDSAGPSRMPNSPRSCLIILPASIPGLTASFFTMVIVGLVNLKTISYLAPSDGYLR